MNCARLYFLTPIHSEKTQQSLQKIFMNNEKTPPAIPPIFIEIITLKKSITSMKYKKSIGLGIPTPGSLLQKLMIANINNVLYV